MARKKKMSQPAITLQIVSTPEDSKPHLIDPKLEAELKELIEQINGKSKRKEGREDTPHTEHDPNLPPAA